ncbi:hypothetical protein VTK73DRAFT_9210 [Phialemonium thermophilum]|uniref:Zn(2)-C6 fungal-type domain-containing protein n=1 Tax=Phialemonium thermophilum TaxID=223376 RepID=A0ABR3W4D2_9PEZI
MLASGPSSGARSSRAGRTRAKAKSGCRTCKIRKVKCDEGYPVCQRCASTGRVCDGYGIWGGGGRAHEQRHHSSSSLSVSGTPRSLPLHVVTNEQLACLEWFRCRVSLKLPGFCVSDFWTSLLLQASASEPAVLHAVLALSSLHRGVALGVGKDSLHVTQPTPVEQRTLRHYLAAIAGLRPHFQTRTQHSRRVTLIACVLFVCLDLLRGHFAAAQVHLDGGLKLLSEMPQGPSPGGGETAPSSSSSSYLARSCRPSTDQSIVEAFATIHAPVALFKHFRPPASPQPICAPLLSVQTTFLSFEEAEHCMRQLLYRISNLTAQARRLLNGASSSSPSFSYSALPSSLRAEQLQIRRDLASWLASCEASANDIRHVSPLHNRDVFFPVLTAYHKMLAILVDTCLAPGDEMAFDACAEPFARLAGQLAAVWTRMARKGSLCRPSGFLPFDMANSTVCLGWVPMLYFVATKCRVRRTRHQALRLLEKTCHREGIWDSRLTLVAARKIVDLEERDFYGQHPEAVDDSTLFAPWDGQDPAPERLPKSFRLVDVEMVFQGDPAHTLLLLCSREHDGGRSRVCVGEYDILAQTWQDGEQAP